MLQGLDGVVEYLVSHNMTLCVECLASLQRKLQSVTIQDVG